MVDKLVWVLVWKGAKWYVRRRFRPAMLRKPALAGIVLIGIGAAAVAARSKARS